MSSEEKNKYNEELSAFVTDELPLLTILPENAEQAKDQRDALMTGFSLSTAFPFCREFVRERIMFSDFGSSVCQRLAQYFQEIIKQTSLATFPLITSTEQSTSLPLPNNGRGQGGSSTLPTRHRGRPTKTEAEAYTAAVAAKAAHDEAIHPSIFPQPKDAVSGDQSPEYSYAMREYRWLLSEPLQHDIDNIRDYRTAFSDASQKAKFLAEQSASVTTASAVGNAKSRRDAIAQYAQEAKRLNALIEGIYQSADRELAEACLRLKYDPHYTKRMTDRGVNTEELRQALVPKYKTVIGLDPSFKQSVLDKIHDEDPALAAQRKALATAKSEVDAIRKYMLRTDKPATAKRIATMEKRLARLRELDSQFPSLKIEPDSYLAIINKTKSEATTSSTSVLCD